MRMDVAGDLVRSQFHHVSQSQLGKQLGHFGTDHVGAENLAIFFIYDDLDKARRNRPVPSALPFGWKGKRPILML